MHSNPLLAKCVVRETPALASPFRCEMEGSCHLWDSQTAGNQAALCLPVNTEMQHVLVKEP